MALLIVERVGGGSSTFNVKKGSCLDIGGHEFHCVALGSKNLVLCERRAACIPSMHQRYVKNLSKIKPKLLKCLDALDESRQRVESLQAYGASPSRLELELALCARLDAEADVHQAEIDIVPDGYGIETTHFTLSLGRRERVHDMVMTLVGERVRKPSCVQSFTLNSSAPVPVGERHRVDVREVLAYSPTCCATLPAYSPYSPAWGPKSYPSPLVLGSAALSLPAVQPRSLLSLEPVFPIPNPMSKITGQKRPFSSLPEGDGAGHETSSTRPNTRSKARSNTRSKARSKAAA